MPPLSPSWIVLSLLVIAMLLAFAIFSRWLLRNPRGDFEAGFMWHGARIYSRFMHHLQVSGRENIPETTSAGPLILVINHTAGVDPVLVQASCPFEIRWVMASDMRHPLGERIWRWLRVIFVDRAGKGKEGAEAAAAMREAIRHVRHGQDGGGGVLGIFPEGAIERPPKTLLPFQPGVGFLIRRTGAKVLPVVVEGTPHSLYAWTSLYRTSRARITFYPTLDYSTKRLPPDEIADDLRNHFARWTGWPTADKSPPEVIAQPETRSDGQGPVS